MFPIGGLSSIPYVGNLETTLREDNLNESFFGSEDFGSVTSPATVTGKRDTLWSVSYVSGVVTFSRDGKVVQVFEQSGIRELSAAFDRYMLPVVVYKTIDKSYIRYFNVVTKTYVVLDLGIITNPRVCFDDRRPYFRSEASVILGFYIADKLYVKTSDDSYQYNQLIKTETQTENYLEQICMGDNNRLHFVTYTLEQ